LATGTSWHNYAAVIQCIEPWRGRGVLYKSPRAAGGEMSMLTGNGVHSESTKWLEKSANCQMSGVLNATFMKLTTGNNMFIVSVIV